MGRTVERVRLFSDSLHRFVVGSDVARIAIGAVGLYFRFRRFLRYVCLFRLIGFGVALRRCAEVKGNFPVQERRQQSAELRKRYVVESPGRSRRFGISSEFFETHFR